MTSTDDLIQTLATSPRSSARQHRRRQGGMIALALGLSLLLHLGILGPRPDLAVVVAAPDFNLKILLLAALAAFSLILLRRVSTPDSALSPAVQRSGLLVLALTLLGSGSAAFMLRSSITPEVFACVFWIGLFGTAPLLSLLWLLRNAAPGHMAHATHLLALASWSCSTLAYTLHCNADLSLPAPLGNLAMLFFYLLALPLFLAAAHVLRPVFTRW